MRLLVHRNVDARRNVDNDRMRVDKRKANLLDLHLGAVTDADVVALLLESVGHTPDSIRHQAARESMELAEFGILTLGARDELRAFDLELDAGRDRLFHGAL